MSTLSFEAREERRRRVVGLRRRGWTYEAIAEVRAYFGYSDRSNAELAGFPYGARGYLAQVAE